MEGLHSTLHKPIHPFFKKELKTKTELTEQTAFVNNFLATIDGVRVEFVDKLCDDSKSFTLSNVQTFKDSQIYIEDNKTKERKVETKKPITLVRINKNINYTDFAKLILQLEEHLNQKQNTLNLDSDKETINITDYQGNLLGWQSQQLEELAENVKSEKAKKAILAQAEEYRTIANILLKKDSKNKEFRLDTVGVNDELDTTKMETYTINQQRLHYAKQEYRSVEWKRDYLKILIDDEVEGLKKLEQQKQHLKTKNKELEDKKDKDSINLKTLNYTQIFYIERLIEAYNSKENSSLQSVINEAMCASLKTRLESSFNDVVMKSGIKEVSKGVFEEVDKKFSYEEESSSNWLKNIAQKIYVNVLDRNKVKVKQIEDLANKIKQEKDINQKSKLEVEFAKKVNEIISNEDLFKYISADDKIGTEAIQTLSQLSEEQKYEVNCTIYALLQEMFLGRYLNRYLLAMGSADHASLTFDTSGIEVQTQTGLYIDDDENWKYVGDFEITFQAWQFDWLYIRYSDLKNYDKALKYIIKANKLTNYSHPGILNNLGNLYYNLQDYDQAVKYIIKANELTNWKNPMHLNNLGFAYIKLKNYNQAISTYNKALQIDKENIKTLYSLGRIYSLTGKKELMLQHLQKVIDKDKKFKEEVKKDADFEKYWEDEDFKRIVS